MAEGRKLPWRKLLGNLPALLGVCLLVGAIYVVWKEFRTLNLADIGVALRNMPPRALWLAFMWTFLSYWVLTFYDRLGTIYAGNKVSYGRVSFASFCAYSLSHNLGFAAVSGAAVRYRLYAHWGLTPVQIAKTIAFCSLTFGLGGMVLGGAVLVFEPDAVPFVGELLPPLAMKAIGVTLWAVVAGYVSLSGFVPRFRLLGHEVELPNWRMAILQVLLAAVDVAVTVNIMFQLLPNAPGLTYVRFLGVYLASYSAGLAANVPGGIGVFDSGMLLGLKGMVGEAEILAAIVVFRLFYYIIPLFLAGSMFAGNEIVLRGGALLSRRGHGDGRLARRAQAMSRWSEPALAVVTATGAVTLCGVILLSLGILNQQPDYSWIDPDYADLASEAGQFVPSLIGAALMVMAVGLSRRVTLAWGGTIVLLLLAAGFTAAQAQPLWIPGVLVIAALLVAPFRNAYYRHAKLLSNPFGGTTGLSLLALVLCTIALGAFEPRLRMLTVNSWWEVVLSPDVPNQLRITVAFAVLLAMVALWRLIRPVRVKWVPWAEGKRQYAALGAVPPHEADGIVMGETGRAGIPFRRLDRVLLGLGDPAGSVADRVSAIWRLRDLAAQEGLDPAVWRAGPGLLKVYADLGMTALPLDAAGLPIANDGPGSATAGQYLCCVAERDLPVLLPLLPKLAGVKLPDAAD